MEKLQPGQMALFYHRSELKLGLMTAVHDNVLELTDTSGQKHQFPHARICLNSSEIFNTDEPPAQLRLFQNQMQQQGDILLKIKDLMQDYQGRTFAQIMEQIKPGTDAQIFAAFHQLSCLNTVFSHKKGVFYLLTATEQQEAEAAQREKQVRAEYLSRVQEWLIHPDTALDAGTKHQLAHELRDLQQEDSHHDLAVLLKKHGSHQPERLIALRRSLGDLPQQADHVLDASGLPLLHSDYIWGQELQIDTDRPLAEVEAFSIDDVDTQDFDDAISFTPQGDSWLLGVHVSDVASFLPLGSPAFTDAISRASSMYLPHTKINMLPRVYCEDKCSLKADQPRPVLSLYCEIDCRQHIVSWHFKLESLKVRANLSYKDADALISTSPWNKLKLFADKLYSERDFASPKAKFSYHLKVDGSQIRVVRTDLHSPARLMMEELMILYNRLFACEASDNLLKLIYRNVDTGEATTPSGNGTSQARAQAYLSPEPKFHNGIGVKAYLHATSPIRRAVDLINQAQFAAWLKDEPAYYSRDDLDALIPKIEKRLRLQRETQRQSERYWLLKYLQANCMHTPINAIMVRSFARGCLFELIPCGFRIVVECDDLPRPDEEVKLVLTQIDPLKGSCRADLIS